MTDTYTIRFTSDGEASGKTAITVAPTNVDNSTSIPIHGKYSTPFGEDLWTSILHVMENFCSATGPSPAKVTMGQLWFDSATQTLKIWRVLSVAPYTIGWAPVNSFDSSGTLSVALKTSVVDNGILDDSATYDGYFVTKGYSDAHYLPRGNYVSGTTALSKAKIKYSTDVTFDTGDTTALVTKKYVDDKIGVVGSLSISVDADGKMTATKAFLGSPDNFILNDTPAFNDYFVTRDYADDRYFLVGTFVNSTRRESRAKIQYSSDIAYASNTDDDYTLVHKKYVADAIAAAAGSGPTIAVPSSGLVLSDGTALSNFAFTAANSGKFLSITQSGNLTWEDSGLPSWLSGTPAKGVLVSDGTAITPTIGTSGQFLKTIDTNGVLSIEWSGSSLPSWFPQTAPTKGVLVSDGTNVTSSIGGANTVLTVDASDTLQWVAKSSLGGGGVALPSTKGVLYINSTGSPTVVGSEGNDTVLSIDNTGAYMWIPKTSLGGSGTGWTGTEKWRDESANRFTATTYTNRTGFPIVVSIDDSVQSNNGLQLYCDGAILLQSVVAAANSTASLTGIIPAGSTYKVTLYNNSTNTVRLKWRELTLQFNGGSGGSSFTAPSAGVVTSDGTNLASTKGTADQLLSINNAGAYQWIDKSSLGGGGGTTNVVSGAVYSIRQPVSNIWPSGNIITLNIPIQSTTDTVQVVVQFGGYFGTSYLTDDPNNTIAPEFKIMKGTVALVTVPGKVDGTYSGTGNSRIGQFGSDFMTTIPANTPLGLILKSDSASGVYDSYIIATVYSGSVTSSSGGGGSSLAGFGSFGNALVGLLPTIVLPKTGASPRAYYNGDSVANANFAISTPTTITSVTFPPLSVETLIEISIGTEVAYSGSGGVGTLELYTDINGTNIYRHNYTEPRMLKLQPSVAPVTIKMTAQYLSLNGNLSSITTTLTNSFIQVKVYQPPST